MQTKFSQQMMSEINVTPLVDVMLVLLIIFIVTAPLLLQALPVKLPKTVAVMPATTKNIRLTITAGGTLFLDQRAVTLAELSAQLRQLAHSGSEPTVQLHADSEVSYGKLAQVMALAQQAGITKLAFVTTPE